MPRIEEALIVVGVVFDDEDQFLLTQRFDPEFKDAHLRWELPGGKNEPGESLWHTCEREVFEETGFEVEVGKRLPIVFRYTWQAKTRTLGVKVVGFRCKLLTGSPHLNDHKVADMKWVKRDQIDELDLLVGTKEFIEAAQ